MAYLLLKSHTMSYAVSKNYSLYCAARLAADAFAAGSLAAVSTQTSAQSGILKANAMPRGIAKWSFDF
jgi:hypothetical protein